MATLVTDDFSPIVQGDTLKPFAPTIQMKDTTGKIIPFPLTGLTISMTMTDEAGTVKTCTGLWTIDDATNGRCHYHYTANDVNAIGIWTLRMKFTDVNGEFVHSEKKVIEIEAP